MSPMKAKRAAIDTQNKVINKVAKAKTSLEKTAINPGSVTVDAIEASVKNPIAVSGNVAGKALMVAPVPLAVKAAPIGAGSIAVEAAAKKIPAYKKITEKAANKFHEATKLRRGIEEGTNNMVNYLKFA